MIFSLTLVLVLSNIIFFLGFFSLIFAIRSSFYIILSIETMVIAINVNFLFYSIFLNSLTGILFNFFIIILSATEVVVLLTFFVVYFKKTNNMDLKESFTTLKY